MELTKEYLAQQEDVISRNFQFRRIYVNTTRFLLLRAFCEGYKKILSVGCGSYEPLQIGATHACDVSSLSHHLLKKQLWQGAFSVCSCDELPFPGLSFDVAVCSEVIEHLPNLEIVKKTFQELNRVALNWIVTTPCNPLGPLNTEPDHKFAFSAAQLRELSAQPFVKIYKDEIYFYVVKSDDAKKISIFDEHFRSKK